MCAYLKVYHPSEFIVALFNSFDGKPDKFDGCYQEAKRLNVEVTPINFDNPTTYCELIDGKVNYGIKLVKHLNVQVAESLSNLKDKHYESFVDLLATIAEETQIDSRQMKILIELGFFDKFGDKKLLSDVYNDFKNGKGIKYDKKYVDKTKEKRLVLLREHEDIIRSEFNGQANTRTMYSTFELEKEYYGFIRTTFPKHKSSNTFAIVEINSKYTPRLYLYNVKTGENIVLKVKKKKFYNEMGYELLYIGDILDITGTSEEGKWKIDDEGNWSQDDSIKEAYLETCKLIERHYKEW